MVFKNSYVSSKVGMKKIFYYIKSDSIITAIFFGLIYKS